MKKDNTKLKSYLFMVLAGLLYALGFPNVLGETIFLSSIISFYIFINRLSFFRHDISYSFTHDLKLFLVFSFCANLIGYYWISHVAQEFGQLPISLSYLVWVFHSFIVFPHLLIFIILLKLLRLKKFRLRIFNETSPYFGLSFAIILTLLEYFTPQMFETHLGHSWLSLAPFIGLAPIFGKPLFSFVSFYLVFFILHLKNRQELRLIPLFTFMIVIILNFALKLQYNHESKDFLNLRIVQANIGSMMKLESEGGDFRSVGEVISKYYDLTTQPYTLAKQPDLIIWPETAFPQVILSERAKNNSQKTPNVFTRIHSIYSSDIFLGGYDQDLKGSLSSNFEVDYNATFLLTPNKQNEIELSNWYHKVKLIPFGETLPFGPFNKFLSKYITNISYFKKGDRFINFQTSKGYYFSSNICYEILEPIYVRKYLNSLKQLPHFIINLTNDSWYGKTIEPYQHKYLAHWRSVEFQLPVIRSTNTGISSILYPDGSESQQSALFEEELLDLRMPIEINNHPSYYQLYGLLPLICLWLVLAIIIAFSSRNYLGDWMLSERLKKSKQSKAKQDKVNSKKVIKTN